MLKRKKKVNYIQRLSMFLRSPKLTNGKLVTMIDDLREIYVVRCMYITSSTYHPAL